MNAIANVQTTDRQINQLQQNIQQAVNPVISNPITNGSLLVNQKLGVGFNAIDHGLGRPLQGWQVVRMKGVFSQIFDTQDSNPSQNKTLWLNSSVAVTVNLYVF